MTLYCALCGRLTLHPALMVAGQPIGPKCARRAGLKKLKAKKQACRVVKHRAAAHDRVTGDLFETGA